MHLLQLPTLNAIEFLLKVSASLSDKIDPVPSVDPIVTPGPRRLYA